MKKAYFNLFAATLLLASCQWDEGKVSQDPAIFTDTIAYQYKNIKERAADCGERSDSSCTHVSIQYPEFKEHPELNDTIKKKLLVMFAMDGKADTSLTSYSKNFIKQYTEFKAQNPESPMYYELNSYANILNQDSGLVAIQVGGYTFQGGAHGSTYTGFINWDTKNKKNIKLADIFKPGYEAELNKIAEGIFRKEEKLTDTSSLARNYFFKDNVFALNNNFLITPIGLKFLYNQYEIKPYAAGQTQLVIPYVKIRQLLKPNTVVTQYVK